MTGVTWHLETVSDPEEDPLTLAFVRDQHLRSPNGTAEDSYIRFLITASLLEAESRTKRSLRTQTVKLVLDRFPCAGEAIVLPVAPVQSVESITYVDEDGVTQTWGGSPLPYTVLNPTLTSNKRAEIVPAYDEEYPTTRVQRDAVEIELVVGYGDDNTPEPITAGRLLVIGELYKQRSESVHAFNQNPAIIRARNLWERWTVYR